MACWLWFYWYSFVPTDNKNLIDLAHDLFPLNRSITGPGVRESLALINDWVDGLVEVYEIPSGSRVLDWEIPLEWEVLEAYVLDPDGKKIFDFQENNLHLVGYSTPIACKVTLAELKQHLFTLPERPRAVPYVTSYYNKTWGFCCTQEAFDCLREGVYEVVIKSRMFPGSLTFGEVLIPGKTTKEVFFSTYICHPSMANNEVSGPVVMAGLINQLREQSDKLNYSYRFAFVPETIGAIAYLSERLNVLKSKIFAGFNISCVGDERAYSYLPTRNGNTFSDRVLRRILEANTPNYIAYSWANRGSDERQYNAPGIDLPIASFMRSKYGTYPEYHSSDDTIGDVVTERGLHSSLQLLVRLCAQIEQSKFYSAVVLGEPQLSRRKIVSGVSTRFSYKETQHLLDILSMCDGIHSEEDISAIFNIPATVLAEAIEFLVINQLISLSEPNIQDL